MPLIAVRTARRNVRCKENTRASIQTGQKRRRVTQTQRKARRILGLIEVPDRRASETERFGSADSSFVRRAIIRDTAVLTDIFQSCVDLELIVQVVDDLTVDTCAAFEPRCRDQPVI